MFSSRDVPSLDQNVGIQVIKNADIVFLAVKPQFVAPVLKEVRQHLTEKHTIVSIAAGKTLASLKVLPSLLQSPTADLQHRCRLSHPICRMILWL